jgi:NAD(P)-dependent dehydrogenase (short-subunit alcohol dehydrogenase family)
MQDLDPTDPPPTPDLFRLDGQVAIVTGGAGLLGEQHGAALAECGAHVVLADLNVEVCEQRARQLTARNPARALAIPGDVTCKESWSSLLEEVLAEFGRVDILVNNAAFTNQSRSAHYTAEFSEFPVEDWHQILEVNLTGSFLGCQVVGGQMVQQGSGSIINIASLYGVVSPNHRLYPGTGTHQPVAYSVSKSGVISLTRYLATLWGEQGVRVNCITPGGVYDQHPEVFLRRYARQSPMGRMARKDEMRGALIYLASAASGYCTGHNLVVDGGWTAW